MNKDTQSIDWPRFPKAEKYINSLLHDFSARMPEVQRLEKAMSEQTSTRLLDWMDHLVLSGGPEPAEKLQSLGFELENVSGESGEKVYHHPEAVFPRILLKNGGPDSEGKPVAAAIRVESISDFLAAQRLSTEIQGSPLSPFRRAALWQNDSVSFFAVERRGHRGFVPLDMPSDFAAEYIQVRDTWTFRKRHFEDALDGMKETLHLVKTSVSRLGASTAAWLVFECERAYWLARNTAGRVQKQRQDGLGLGLANHDHHTFRSSRSVFLQLIMILETLGFIPRERLCAGQQAGWGAQVLEHPRCGLVAFADVDLAPDEVTADFAHEPLRPRPDLGSVGLWCALHGESLLSSGLHHLALRLDFHRARTGLKRWRVEMMKPFSSLAHLKQTFSAGEKWDVSDTRLDHLNAVEAIQKGRKKKFLKDGVLGSHLECIQRTEGFKGFNQKGISDIIRRTDPRK